MARLDADHVWTALSGDRRPRRVLLAAVVALVGLGSVGFLLGLPVGLYEFPGWLVLVLAVPVVAGAVHAGLVTTVASLWLVLLWGYVFPPLVGYLTGEWTGTGRYAHPRLAAYAYGSARDELMGGIDQALGFGVGVAVVVGTVGYLVGTLGRWAVLRVQAP